MGDDRRATIAFGLPDDATTSPPCGNPTPSISVATAAHPHCDIAFEARVIPLGGGEFGLEIRSVTTPLAGFPECGSTPVVETSTIDAGATFTPVLTTTPRYELSLTTFPSATFPSTKISALAEVVDSSTGTSVAVASRDDFTRSPWYDQQARRFAFGGSFPLGLYPAPYDDFLGVTNVVPPDPTSALFPNRAPPFIDPTVPTSVKSATEFLYDPVDTDTSTIQTAYADPLDYIDPSTIVLERAAVISGTVKSRDGDVIFGASVTIKGHPEFGRTGSRMDGKFDMAVNGGGPLTVAVEKFGYLPVERQVRVPWNGYASIGEVMLIARDVATPIVMDASSLQVAQGSEVTDVDGTRRATLMFPANTTATVTPADPGETPFELTGTVQVRATEYTVGPNGLKAMPAELPVNTAYTYAVELGIDEAGEGSRIDFNQPVYLYVDHFLANPTVNFQFTQPEDFPAGYYDRTKSTWVPSDNGLILRIVSTAGGIATLDLTGDGVADPGQYGTPLDISDDERTALASYYSEGAVLWRIPVKHFSPWDLNLGWGVPEGGAAPLGTPPGNHGPPPGCPPTQAGSVIGCTVQTLGESLPVTGTGYDLHYSSDRVYGRAAGRRLTIYFGSTAPGAIPEFRGVEIEVSVAGKFYSLHLSSIPTTPYEFDLWDGKEAFGRDVNGNAFAQVRVGYTYQGAYKRVENFGHHGNGTQITLSKTRQMLTLWQNFEITFESWDARGVGLGGWTFDVHHTYDPTGNVLRLGNGRRRDFRAQSPVVQPAATLPGPKDVAVAPDGTVYIAYGNQIARINTDGTIQTMAGMSTGGFNGYDGSDALTVRLNDPRGIDIGPDGDLYITDSGNHLVRKLTTAGDGPWPITTIVGRNSCNPGCTFGFSGDGGLADAAFLRSPWGLAVGPDGSIYIVDSGNRRIRRVSPDGVIRTVAGTGADGDPLEGSAAVMSGLRPLYAVDVSPDGEVYFTSDRFGGGTSDTRVMKIDRSGLLRTVAGVAGSQCTDPCSHTDGAVATATPLLALEGLSIGSDGSVFVTERHVHGAGAPYVYRIGPDGLIRRFVGQDTTGFTAGDGGPAALATFGSLLGTDPGPDGTLYVADQANNRIRKVVLAATGLSASGYTVASEDGREMYVFDPSGRHLRTRDAFTGADIHVFGYDDQGRLNTISDRGGNVTAIHQPAFGAAGGECDDGRHRAADRLR